jgi:hypothetical protein
MEADMKTQAVKKNGGRYKKNRLIRKNESHCEKMKADIRG